MADPGLPGGAPWTPEHRAGLLARLERDKARRAALTERRRRALDGVVHALRPDSMDAALPARTLVAYDLDAPEGPVAAFAVGDLERPTHMTWQVSGMGIAAHTAAWGSAREAAQLALAQRGAGAERPCVVAWLGYPAPSWWRTLGDGRARQGAALLAEHVAAWHRWRDAAGAAAAGTAGRPEGGVPPAAHVHTALEAHSYGTLVAAYALERLAAADPPRRLDALVVSGAIGLPRRLAADPALMGLSPGQVFEARAPGDLLALLGRRLARRAAWHAAVRLPVAADAAAGLAGVRGHDTSRRLPRRAVPGPATPRGYRDAGTVTLGAIARATVGQWSAGRPSAEGPSSGDQPSAHSPVA